MKTNILLLLFVIGLICSTHGQNPDENPCVAGDAYIDSELENLMQPMVFTYESMAKSIPSAVDNSTNMYMPPIFNQWQSGSCVHCSEVAYTFTYEMNRYRNVEAGSSWTGTEEDRMNLYHPFFTYNFKNEGNGSFETGFGSAFNIVCEDGCPTLNDYYDSMLNQHFYPGSSEESQMPFRRWMDGEEKYIAATENRISYQNNSSGSYTITWGSTYESLDNLKRWLSNHNSSSNIGGLAVISVNMGNGYTTTRIPSGTPHANEFLLTSWALTGGHAMTIVGYDDNICCFDFNENQTYDYPTSNTPLTLCERGAFKVANSWGSSWKNSGYIWVPYSLMRSVMNNNYRAYTCVAIDAPEKTVYLSATVKHAQRNKLQLVAGKSNTANSIFPTDTASYKIFNYQGGLNPMHGIDDEPLEIGLDYGNKLGLDNIGKIFLLANTKYIANYIPDSCYIQDFSLIDYRWNEVFQLDCPTSHISIGNNTTTTLSIDYDLLPHESAIDASYTCSSNKVARRTVNVTNNATFEVAENVDIDLYGTDNHPCSIHIANGSCLSIQDSVTFTAKRGICSIVIDGNITIGDGVRFIANEGASFDIIINNGNNLTFNRTYFSKCNLTFPGRNITFNECVFLRTPLSIVADNTFSNHTIVVNACTFSNFQNVISNAIYINGYSSYTVSNCSIVKSSHSLVDERYFENGINIMNCGNSFTDAARIVNDNYIEGCIETGLIMYSSTGDIKMNHITDNECGVKLLNNCNIGKFSGNCAALTAELTQFIHDNDSIEVYFSRNCFPSEFKNNCITSTESHPYIYCNYDGRYNQIQLNIEENYWGSNIVPSIHFQSEGNYATFDYQPTWSMGACQGSVVRAVERALQNADSLSVAGNYSLATEAYKNIVENYPETTQAANALGSLLSLERSTNTDLESLQNYYMTNSVILSDTLLEKLGSSLANRCDEIMENYEEAITWYENVITDESSSFNDSIFATIDLGSLYEKIEEQGTKGIQGKLSQYIPKSHEAYTKQTDYALSLIPATKKTATVVDNYPETYWTDIVTEQPEGYQTDANGNVHIYSAEGLAWLSVVSNGLNGQEADDFTDKTVFLEENIDLDGHRWFPISATIFEPNNIVHYNKFRGVFEGNAHVINNLLLYEGRMPMGLFENVDYGEIRNIVIRDFKVDVETRSCGILAIRADYSLIENCYANGSVLYSYIGGMFETISNSTVRNCMVRYSSFKGNDSSGGFCVDNVVGLIENCASIVDTLYWPLFGESAGIAAINQGTIKNCYSYWGELKEFEGYSGLAPRSGVAISNEDIGIIENSYFNRMDPLFGFDDQPVRLNYGVVIDAVSFYEYVQLWRLIRPITIGTAQAYDLLDVLNLWVNNQPNSGDYLTWCEDTVGINLGLPIFRDMDLTSVEEKPGKMDLCVYPNPVKDKLIIELPNGEAANRIVVYNNTGALVIEQNATHELNLQNTPSGLYFVVVETESGIIFKNKIVKE